MAVKVINPNRDIERALKEIKKVDKTLIADMRKGMKKEAAPTVKSIKDYLKWLDPDTIPLNDNGESRIERGVLIKQRGEATKWNRQLVLRGIRVKFGGPNRKSKMGRTSYSIMSIIQANAAGAIYDTAGSRNMGKPGATFIENIEGEDKPHKAGERKGQKGPSRYMWPGAEEHLPQLRLAATAIMNDMIVTFNRKFQGTR